MAVPPGRAGLTRSLVAWARAPHLDGLRRPSIPQLAPADFALCAGLCVTVLPAQVGANGESTLERDAPCPGRTAAVEAGGKAGQLSIPVLANELVGTGGGPGRIASATAIPTIADQPRPTPAILLQGKAFTSLPLVPGALDEAEADREALLQTVGRAHEAGLTWMFGVALAAQAEPILSSQVIHAAEWRLAVGLPSTSALVGPEQLELILAQHGQHSARTGVAYPRPRPPRDGTSNGDHRDQPQRHRQGDLEARAQGPASGPSSTHVGSQESPRQESVGASGCLLAGQA